MRMIYADRGPSPLNSGKPKSADRDGTAGWWGAFSIERFANASPLQFTHEDANGWLAYLRQFEEQNFWFQDGGVQPWAYEETYDNWQDRYGMDAVTAVYHSGHGFMRDNGQFIASMGAAWDGRNIAESQRMAFGNEKVNYVFWSTCFSLRVLGAHNPVRTWGASNLGARMIFGFETTSIDHPGYGSKFWEKWRAGQTFCEAWLNASWDIDRGQAPSVAAAGATQAEANDRLNTERDFHRGHVSDAWYAWRWYNARESLHEPLTTLPMEPQTIALAPRDPSTELTRLAEAVHFPAAALQEVHVERQGVLSANAGDRYVSTAPQAARWVRLGEANHRNTRQLPTEEAVRLAEEFARQHANGAELIVDEVHDLWQNSGAADGSQIGEPVSLQTHVTFRQAFDGVPVITPGRGEIRVALDNDGSVVQAHLSTRDTANGATLTPNSMVAPPTANGRTGPAPAPREPAEALATAQRRLVAELGAVGANERQSAVDVQQELEIRDVPGTMRVGFEIEGNEAYPAARKQIEIRQQGSEFVTRRWVVAPLAR
ncbi:DUF6345 domain-containing protein [Streptomyces spongiae]|uniref:Uncharacterized protein n=1 Tax=Streptomyces spongiae TaxID=565072 RepID=A0A5N8XCT0_9ACTN|nr:DUF6345 domain-containing protein [Streptomyces spongiae]MPY57252.1 hypothetical protein [Streptomyces spongiae]